MCLSRSGMKDEGGILLNRLFPNSIDNTYEGSKFALWMLLPITLLTIYRGGIHVFLPDSGVQSIATIPLDSYSNEAAANIVAFVAQWGLLQLIMGVFFVFVFLRYRSLVSCAYVLLLIDYVGRNILGTIKPIAAAGTPPGIAMGNILIVLAAVGLALSLRRKKSNSIDTYSD